MPLYRARSTPSPRGRAYGDQSRAPERNDRHLGSRTPSHPVPRPQRRRGWRRCVDLSDKCGPRDHARGQSQPLVQAGSPGPRETPPRRPSGRRGRMTFVSLQRRRRSRPLFQTWRLRLSAKTYSTGIRLENHARCVSTRKRRPCSCRQVTRRDGPYARSPDVQRIGRRSIVGGLFPRSIVLGAAGGAPHVCSSRSRSMPVTRRRRRRPASVSPGPTMHSISLKAFPLFAFEYGLTVFFRPPGFYGVSAGRVNEQNTHY
jgi:hypothetical protein